MNNRAENRIQGILLLVFLTVGRLTGAASNAPASVGAVLAADSRTFTITAPGLNGFHGGFAATIRIDGQQKELSSTNGAPAGVVSRLIEETPHGLAEVMTTTLHYQKEQIDLIFRLGRVPGVPGVLAQVGIRNAGKVPVNLVALTPVTMAGQMVGNPADWFISSMVPSYDNGKPVVSVAELREPLQVEEYGGVYRRDGTGFVFGPVGVPTAFVYTTIVPDGTNRVSFCVQADMSGVRVDPGETRWGQQVVLLMMPPRQALACWAEWVAKTHGAGIPKGALSGWGSWYFLGREVSGKDIEDVADAVLTSKDRLRPDVIQIDRGYEDSDGKKESNNKFPAGLGFYAKRIASTGARPGLRVAANVNRNFEDPQAADDLLQRCRRAVQYGFTYLRVDVNYKSAPFAPRPVTARKTVFEALRSQYEDIRKAVGPDTYLMSCDTWPNRAEVGLVDASRTGHGASRLRVRAAMDDVLRSYQLQDRWFNVDNEGWYMGTEVANISQIVGGWPLVRTWMSMVGMSCGAAMTSDPWYWEDFKPYWRNFEVLHPAAKERTEVLDLCTSRDWPRLVGHVRRDWGDMTVALLWNPGTSERAITLDFAQAGLDPHRRYAVWSFWDNRYLGVAEGAWTTPALAPSASQHLRFTDLDRSPGNPVLIGSSLHIYCGAAEIKRVTNRHDAIAIELTDAGAREGDLFVYSRLPLVWKGAVGCVVTGIASAGEYVWRISIADRQCGKPQQVELGILLPVTQQAWFWLMIVIVAASLLFAASRYIAIMRIQREHVLDQERARIAQDLHDDLGAGLTEIAMLSDVARQDSDRPDAVNAHLERIFRSGSEMAQALDEIVWAINPSNDTLEKLVSFIGEFAQGILESGGIRFRLDAPTTVPTLDLNSKTRHQLCMAVKECLNNIVKHAQAHEVNIRISFNGETLEVMVADDGVGFDVVQLSNRSGTHDGLGNLRQRMADIGGSCEIQSAPGKGTRVLLQVKV